MGGTRTIFRRGIEFQPERIGRVHFLQDDFSTISAFRLILGIAPKQFLKYKTKLVIKVQCL